MEAKEPMPRLVFGGVPSFQEAKDATAELKDALDKVYLSSSESTGSVDPFAANPSLSLVSGPALETAISDVTPTPVPRHVFHEFSLLSRSPEAQNVAASIASDPNVWNAVMENPALQDYFVSLPRNDGFQDVQSPQPFEKSSAESQPGNSDSGFNNIMQNIKVKVLKMVPPLGRDAFTSLVKDKAYYTFLVAPCILMLALGFSSTIGIRAKFRLPSFLPDALMDEATWVDWKLSLRWMREVYFLVFGLVAPCILMLLIVELNPGASIKIQGATRPNTKKYTSLIHRSESFQST
uniref:Uncharacterized protein n=1 Tax=Fagus sylvatica TaxID=28930 RepID=A0A2N9HLC1_FAGSY